MGLLFKNKNSIVLFDKKQYKKLCGAREYKHYKTYGRVFIISTKTIKNTLFILENIIPLTFFILSILGSIIYKKFGHVELLRIDKDKFYNSLKELLTFKL